ncbi:alpha/beta hydrolase-fold protein [Paenibacillus sediminis]|uniref:Alpha/beta superfamily hydrolase n=1 Tax=Paenibacillus sediminis TaxID=664909 RepID=A0ABS4H3D4_9BACL|nr:putative alpha/beta superfamily hydrolase [Paenibacillus sediminis]
MYLPPSYDKSDATYPVLYMQDGQSLFTSDNVEWQVDEALESIFVSKKAPETIVVGISSDPNTRFNEYAPWKNGVGDGGEGDAYADFLAKELKPYIDEHYCSQTDSKHTAIGGSSMGGAYISLYTAVKYPDHFGKVLALSPVFAFNKPPYENYIRKTKADKLKAVYLDSGEKEEQFPAAVGDVKEMAQLLQSDGGLKSSQIKTVIDPKGDYSKTSWQRRFPDAFIWLMNQ